MKLRPCDIDWLRIEVAHRVGIRPCDVAVVGRDTSAGSFKRAVCAHLLHRRGLTRPEIGIVMGRESRWVDKALAIIAFRSKDRFFRAYVDFMWDIYDAMATLVWSERDDVDCEVRRAN
jgi:hypothetical protein